MTPDTPNRQITRSTDRQSNKLRVGCVSFLNALPLIDGLQNHPALDIRYDVPSRLLDDLVQDKVDLALCPVVDYQTSPIPLRIVPVGGIGSEGETLTVRLFSSVPFESTTELYADTDSHTSVILAQVVLHELYGLRPAIRDLTDPLPAAAQTVLLIGDKVIRSAPDDSRYPFQLDLGRAWLDLTSLPFVFAVWMCRQDASLGRVPQILNQQRRHNATQIPRIVARHASDAGFSRQVAEAYLGRILRYDIGPLELAAIERFWRQAHALGLLPRLRPLFIDQKDECFTPTD